MTEQDKMNLKWKQHKKKQELQGKSINIMARLAQITSWASIISYMVVAMVDTYVSITGKVLMLEEARIMMLIVIAIIAAASVILSMESAVVINSIEFDFNPYTPLIGMVMMVVCALSLKVPEMPGTIIGFLATIAIIIKVDQYK